MPVHRQNRVLLVVMATAAATAAFAPTAAAAPASPTPSPLPPEARQALQRAQVPEAALSVVLREVGSGRTRLAQQENRPVNPASLTKLVTTYAALDRLGPAWTWTTPVWLNGPVRGGVLEGSLHIKGSGDPKLVPERLWLLLRRVQQLGVREVRGDIVLDQSAFQLPEGTAADFDGEPSRPYNVRPAALLLNQGTVTYTFTPDAATGQALVTADPALAGAPATGSVPLTAGPCGDWRALLKADWGLAGAAAPPGLSVASAAGASAPTPPATPQPRFTGSYAASCGELSWPLADLEPATFNHRLLAAQWAAMGGQLAGVVRDGAAPAGVKPSVEWRSPPLAEVVRDINKFSNNVMAQQLFLTLDSLAHPGQPATLATARATLRGWLAERLGEATAAEVVIDNGSGLSRDTRISAAALARLLQQAWDSPVMPELLASLPIAGLDGTLRRAAPDQATLAAEQRLGLSTARSPSPVRTGRAHLKTGTLRDVSAVAGYVLSASGRRYVLVAIVHHPNAPAARPALDALLQWAMRDAPHR